MFILVRLIRRFFLILFILVLLLVFAAYKFVDYDEFISVSTSYALKAAAALGVERAAIFDLLNEGRLEELREMIGDERLEILIDLAEEHCSRATGCDYSKIYEEYKKKTED